MSENSTTQQKQWGGIEPAPMKLTTVRSRQAQTNIAYDEQLDDEHLYPTRQPSSTRRYHKDNVSPQELAQVGQQQLRQRDRYDTINVYIRRRSSQSSTSHQQQPRPAHQPESDNNEPETEHLLRIHQRVHKLRFHWLVYLGIGMVVMLILWIVGAIALNWWQSYLNDLRYGHPPTSQCDARVGHNDTQTQSHFLTLNLHHRVEVIEFPGGDATKAKVYLGPILTGQDSDLDIVTVSFKDVNGDGKPALILSVENAKYIYINDNGAFRPLHADKHINM